MTRRGVLWEPGPGRQGLLTRWAWPPPQIHSSRQDPSLSSLGLTLGFPGHLWGRKNHPVQLSILEMGKLRL